MKPDQHMRLDSLAMVNRIAEARGALLHQISVVEAEHDCLTPPKFCVTVDAQRLGPDILAIVRPVVVRELRAQVAALERDLEALGVSVG
ncbi:hypothetical protein [Novosphingobium album (ex Liu et al. 2023)]|uniref:Uncharacterized protein n=1 Tax=Novosphingobium album (ex Liu et al. 2023) TaxID=3031130 RepID=A0ABT5WY18_9SPHN|nr:hypothetical protein [Novosphingobium album (ex Liu et al. 2023)]MDE8654784.1 hypothetical protein [Novosphingobium album (ex Liu et al. 2023)]